MKEEFTQADAIRELEEKLAEAIAANEINETQAAEIKPLLLALLNSSMFSEKRMEIAQQLEEKTKTGFLTEDQVVGIFTTLVSLELKVLHSSIEKSSENIRQAHAAIDIGHLMPANKRPI